MGGKTISSTVWGIMPITVEFCMVYLQQGEDMNWLIEEKRRGQEEGKNRLEIKRRGGRKEREGKGGRLREWEHAVYSDKYYLWFTPIDQAFGQNGVPVPSLYTIGDGSAYLVNAKEIRASKPLSISSRHLQRNLILTAKALKTISYRIRFSCDKVLIWTSIFKANLKTEYIYTTFIIPL